MRITFAVIPALALFLGAPAFAQDAQPEMSEEQLRQLIEAAMAQQRPQPIPVPEGEVVNRQELEGGLIIEDIKIGEGFEIKPGGVVVAHYHGTLKDGGSVFDSSFERGEPVAFPLNGVIQGWGKGVPGMKVGGVRRLTIPSALAYGAQGAGSDIPPNADLVFVIQMVDALQVEDVEIGEGGAATFDCVPVTTHVVKDASGVVVTQATMENPYIWIPGEFNALQFGVDGMRVGGTRILKVPSQMAFIPPQFGSNIPQNVPLTIELKLVAVRNLGMPEQ